MDLKTLKEVEKKIGYEFKEKKLLNQAFDHSSYVDNRLTSNERLEFLGDSILGTVICEKLFNTFPTYTEGDLTKIKSMLVSRRSCAKVTKNLDIIKYLKVGKGMAKSRALHGSIAAGLLEAVIAAIYIDGGYEAAKNFVLNNFDELIVETDAHEFHGNFKSMLQQYAQQNYNFTPDYILLDEKGPDHDKCFETQAIIKERHFSSAWGNNKKEAEQKAAFNALLELGVIELHHGKEKTRELDEDLEESDQLQ